MEYQQILEEQFNNVVDQESLSSIMEQAGDVTAGIASNFSAENILAAIADGRSIFDDQAIIERYKISVLPGDEKCADTVRTDPYHLYRHRFAERAVQLFQQQVSLRDQHDDMQHGHDRNMHNQFQDNISACG